MEDKAKNNSDNNNISVDIIAKIEKSLLGSLKFFKLLFACCFLLGIFNSYSNGKQFNFQIVLRFVFPTWLIRNYQRNFNRIFFFS